MSAPFKVGQGFDVHSFAPSRKLILGGVTIPHDQGLLGHSDADVLVHAICDAVLGAFSLGDLGKWFPDTSPDFKDADSLKLLKSILSAPELSKWTVGNIDSTIIAQKPKMAAYIDQMKSNIANAFSTDKSNISVKATTTEKLGFTGRGEGIAAMATVLFYKS
ncbi:MAG: 2-C-methyl-D-erythritol 2,4-cyclodiphosphate synthase [Lentisphaeraceae bacterium]|nr:2-C-methyl-D-erythritol 2,4-cyclodiphosphate synthase [Lentisphaeraceae bacterium]